MIVCLLAHEANKHLASLLSKQTNNQTTLKCHKTRDASVTFLAVGASRPASALWFLYAHNPNWSASRQHLSPLCWRREGKCYQSRATDAGDGLLSQQLLWQRMLLATVCYHNRKILDLWSGVRIWILNLIRISSWIRSWIVGPAPSYWC